MNQPTFRSSNFLLQAQNPPVQGLFFPEQNRSDPAAFCPAEINRWENEGGAVAVRRSAAYVIS
jgi:hypothetical protein